MKKLLALLLVLAMVFSMMTMLTACGEDEDDNEKTSDEDEKKDDEDKDDEDEEPDDKEDPAPAESIVGTWEGKIELSDMLGDSYDGAGAVLVILEFNSDGEYGIAIDHDSFTDAIETMILQMIDDEDMTEDEFESEAGMSVEDFVDQVVSQADDEGFFDLKVNREYELDGNKLYLDGEEDYYKVTLSGDSLKIGSYSGTEGNLENITFER